MSKEIVTQLIDIDDDLNFAIKKAKKLFFEGGIFAYPTDTIYGIGANAFNHDALEKIDKIKKREEWKRYILLIDSINSLMRYVKIDNEKHYDFLIEIWPNPVSVVLNLNEETKKLLMMETCAFRIPNHFFCQKLLNELKIPIVSTSANRSKQPPINDPDMIMQEFNYEIDAVFKTKKKSFNQNSTVISLAEGNLNLIRDGKISFNELEKKYNKIIH